MDTTKKIIKQFPVLREQHFMYSTDHFKMCAKRNDSNFVLF